ncbi:MAG: diadenylate cyclase CdaA [Erysipelotrichaceae bacterium]|nr:diadenylate cyclase CdaA [Erysipelotrichaceae bacterium]
MTFSFSYESVIHYIQAIADIVVVWIILYYIMKVVKSNQKTIQTFQGLVLVIIIQAVSKLLGLKTVNQLASTVVSWGVIAIIVIFQPEIRLILERLGKSNAFARISTLTSSEKENLIDELMTATAQLSASKTGALITLEQGHSLSQYIDTGIKINSLVSAELICSIFMTTTPLHDGAVIIQGDKLACASAYFPPTTMELPSKYGARHRAAIGISELTDAVTIVVSEETGRVALTREGKLLQMNEKKLRDYLERVILNKEQLTGSFITPTSQQSVSVDSFINEKEIDYAASGKTGRKGEDELENMSNHDMKNFQTMNFRAVEPEDKKTSKIVESVISNAVNEDKLNDSIVVKKVSVPKEPVINYIKTTNVTTPDSKKDEKGGK